MPTKEKHGRIIVKDGWVMCPYCRTAKLTRLLPGTKAKNVPLLCRKCKHETILNIDEESQSP